MSRRLLRHAQFDLCANVHRNWRTDKRTAPVRHFLTHIQLGIDLCLVVACFNLSFQDWHINANLTAGFGTSGRGFFANTNPLTGLIEDPLGSPKGFLDVSVDYNTALPDDQKFQLVSVSGAE
jgi:hypothetical protein